MDTDSSSRDPQTPGNRIRASTEPPDFLGSWRWRLPAPFERTEDWKARVAQQCEALARHTASWLRPGQPVQINPDPRAGGGDVSGRMGTIHRLCSPVFADYVYVTFAPQGREKLSRTRLLTLESLTPIA